MSLSFNLQKHAHFMPLQNKSRHTVYHDLFDSDIIAISSLIGECAWGPTLTDQNRHVESSASCTQNQRLNLSLTFVSFFSSHPSYLSIKIVKNQITKFLLTNIVRKSCVTPREATQLGEPRCSAGWWFYHWRNIQFMLVFTTLWRLDLVWNAQQLSLLRPCNQCLSGRL